MIRVCHVGILLILVADKISVFHSRILLILLNSLNLISCHGGILLVLVYDKTNVFHAGILLILVTHNRIVGILLVLVSGKKSLLCCIITDKIR